jgi:hypothetical protein
VQKESLRELFERMAVYAEYRVYWHSDTKPCLTNVVERINLDNCKCK